MASPSQPMDVDNSKRKSTSSGPDVLQDVSSPTNTKKTKATTVPPSPIPPRIVGYHRFLTRKPHPFNRQRYNKTGKDSVHTAALVCHNIMLNMFPDAPLETGVGKQKHMTPLAMESALKDILVNNRNSTVMLFLLNAQAMDPAIIQPNQGTLLKAKIVRAAHALQQQHYCVIHGKDSSGYVSNSTANEWTSCPSPNTASLDDPLDTDSSEEETTEELQHLEDIKESAKAHKTASAQQKLAADQETADNKRKAKELEWSKNEDEEGAASDKAALTELATTTDVHNKKENENNTTQQEEKTDEHKDDEATQDNLNTQPPAQILDTGNGTSTREQRIASHRANTILKANQAFNSGTQFKYWDTPTIFPNDLAWAKQHRTARTDLDFHQGPPFTEHEPTGKREDKTKDRLCLLKTLEDTISKEWKIFGRMESYDDPEVPKDVFAKFVRHVYTKRGPTYQPSQQDAKRTFLRFTRTSPEFFDGWNYDTGTIRGSKFANFWVACCEALGSKYSIKYTDRLPPKPTPKPKLAFAPDSQIFTAVPSSTGFFLSTKATKNKTNYDPTSLLNVSPTQYDTYVNINMPEATEATEAQAKLTIDAIHHVLKEFWKFDPNLVIHPYPRPTYSFPPGKLHVPYTKNHAFRRSGLKKMAHKYEFNRYSGRDLYVTIGSRYTLPMVLGHEIPFEQLLTDEVRTVLSENRIELTKNILQCNTTCTIGWLLGVHVDTFDCLYMSSVLQCHPRFAGKPIACALRPLKMFDDTEQKGLSYREQRKVIVIMTSTDLAIRRSVTANCFSVWNKQDEEHVKLRPDGTNFKFIEWLSGPYAGNRNPDNSRETQLGSTKQRDIMENSVAIFLHGVTNLDLPILVEGELKTLKQILTTLRTHTNWRFPLFSQINTTKKGEILGICHQGQRREAEEVVQNLYVLLKSKYGPEVKVWFASEVVKDSADISWNSTNLTITNNGYGNEIRDIYSDKYHTQRYSCSDAHLAAKIQAGATATELEEYICDSDSLDDSVSDTEGNQPEQWQFDIDNMFNPDPVIRAGLHFDSASVKSNATGGTNATQLAEMQEEPIQQQTPAEISASAQQTGVDNDAA